MFGLNSLNGILVEGLGWALSMVLSQRCCNVIWKVNDVSRPKSAKDLYNRLQIKKLTQKWTKTLTSTFQVDGTQILLIRAGNIQTARCKSSAKTTVTIVIQVAGSIEHNMGE